MSTEYINYKELYEKEKKRADLLQDDLNSVDLLHYDECAKLRAENTLLKQQIKNNIRKVS